MNRTKGALFAIFLVGMDRPDSPLWLSLITALAQLAASAYLVWYFWSDTTPRESYVQRIAGKRVER